MDGVGLLSQVADLTPATKRVLLTAYADTDAAIAAINDSRVDYYLLKPWDPPEDKLYPTLDDLLADWRGAWRPGYGGVRVIGDRWSADGHRLRDFLSRNNVPYRFEDVERSPDAAALAEGASLPLVVLEDGERMHAPTPAELAARVGLSQRAEREFYDLAIVGGGPAGLASAVYGASEGLRTVLLESQAPGGQAGTSSRIENYLGFPSGLSGADLARRGVAQAERFGVEILAPVHVRGLRTDGPYKILELDGDRELSCHALDAHDRRRVAPPAGRGRRAVRGRRRLLRGRHDRGHRVRRRGRPSRRRRQLGRPGRPALCRLRRARGRGRPRREPGQEHEPVPRRPDRGAPHGSRSGSRPRSRPATATRTWSA